MALLVFAKIVTSNTSTVNAFNIQVYSPENNSPVYSLELLILVEGIARVLAGEPSRTAECHAKQVFPGAVDLMVRVACKG